ncbi:MAG: carbohydrate binding domain-containing protein, partial [Marmoricola sp.]
MLKNKRLRLLGILGALTVPLALGLVVPANALIYSDVNFSPCTSLVGNLVKNCGFEAPAGAGGAVPGWEHLISVNSSVSTNQAKSGTHSLRFGSSSNDDVWTQTVPVTPNTSYVVGANVMALGSTPDNDLTITVTNNKLGNPGSGSQLYRTQDTEITSWTRVGDEILTGSARTMTITISGANPPSQSYVDDVFVIAQPPGCKPIANNAVANCGFEVTPTTSWVHSVSSSSGIASGNSYGGDHSLFLQSSGTSDVWYQIVTVRPHTTYTLRYWDWYYSGSSVPLNNLTVWVSNVAVSGGQLKITKTNVPNQQWKQVTRTFTTGAGSSAVLMFSGTNAPGISRVDDFSLTVTPKISMAKSGTKVVTKLTGLGGQSVWLQKKVGSHWKLVHIFLAPKSGLSKVWALKVPKGKYRAVAKSAPG